MYELRGQEAAKLSGASSDTTPSLNVSLDFQVKHDSVRQSDWYRESEWKRKLQTKGAALKWSIV